MSQPAQSRPTSAAPAPHAAAPAGAGPAAATATAAAAAAAADPTGVPEHVGPYTHHRPQSIVLPALWTKQQKLAGQGYAPGTTGGGDPSQSYHPTATAAGTSSAPGSAPGSGTAVSSGSGSSGGGGAPPPGHHDLSGYKRKGECVFCKIIAGRAPAEVLYRDQQMIVIKDIHPAAPHHYLVIPLEHLPDAKHLSPEHAALVERMEQVARAVLKEQGAASGPDEARTGFHWPPFQSLKHLHMHVLAPVTSLGFFSQISFMPDSWCFVTTPWLLDRLRGIGNHPSPGSSHR